MVGHRIKYLVFRALAVITSLHSLFVVQVQSLSNCLAEAPLMAAVL